MHTTPEGIREALIHLTYADLSQLPCAVVGALLDAEAPDEFVNNLILSVRSLIPVEQLCAEVEKRNRLKLLNPFLEHLVSEGSQVRAVLPCGRRGCHACPVLRPRPTILLLTCRVPGVHRKS